MELQEAIHKRRSIRKFNEKEIQTSDLERILKSARIAPSAKNKQPWHFVILKGKLIHEVAVLLEKKAKKPGDEEEQKIAQATARTIQRANTLILVFNIDPDSNIVHTEQSIGASIEHILLSATELGIGSVWIGMVSLIEKELCELYQMESATLSAAVALGYYDEEKEARPRKSMDEITTWYLEGVRK